MLQASRAALGRDAHGHVDASFPVSSSGHRFASRISASELLAPSAYAEFRSEHRHHLIAHRRRRTVALGPDMRLQFEDRVTVLYQIQEVLRAERAQGLDEAQHEIDTYACLLSDGRQWKATLLIECPCPTERARRLPSLSRAAHELYVETAGTPRLFAEANEDLEDRHLSRPSAVHFLTFALPPALRSALRLGADVTLGCASPLYPFEARCRGRCWRRSPPNSSPPLPELHERLLMISQGHPPGARARCAEECPPASQRLTHIALATAALLVAASARAQTDTVAGAAGSAASLDRVVVTATRGSKAVEKIPGAVSVVTRQDLDDQLLISEDISQVLASQVPGYAPSRQKLTSFGESLRGRNALILFDGIPQTNPLRNGAREGYFADPAVIERIEVVSGASAVQGLGATGGIINYISRTPRSEGTRHTVDLKLSTQGHADDQTWKAGWLIEHKSRFDAVAYVGATTRGVGVDGDGRRLGIESTQGDTQDSKAVDFFGKVGIDIAPQQRLQASLNQYRIAGDGNWKPVPGNRSTGLPTAAEPGTPPGTPPRNRVRTGSLEWSHADLAGGVANAQIYAQNFRALYGAVNVATFQDTSIAPNGSLFDQSEIVADKSGLRLSWVRPDLGLRGLELTAGLDWLSDTSEQRLAQTGRTWVPQLKFQSTAPFAQLEYELGRLTLRGGARHESAHLAVDTYRTLAFYGNREVQGGERSFEKWVKNLGAVWRIGGGWSAFAAYNEGFGLPDVGLVLRAVNRDSQSVDKLIDLQPVLTDNRELGITWRGQLGSFTASVYDSRSELGSQVRVDNTTGIGSVQRLPVQVKGFEFGGELKPRADWTLSATYARTRGKTAATSGDPLDVDLGARSQGPDKVVLAARWAFMPNAVARVQASHFASRHVNPGRTVGTTRLEENFDGYTLADLSVSWASRWGDFGLGVENLFDRQYIGYYAQSNPAGTADDYFAGRGRALSVSWQRSF